MTLMEDVVALQDRLAEAQKARARAEGARTAAETALTNAQAELKRDFDVDTFDAAEALLAQLKVDLTVLVAEISGKLDEMGV